MPEHERKRTNACCGNESGRTEGPGAGCTTAGRTTAGSSACGTSQHRCHCRVAETDRSPCIRRTIGRRVRRVEKEAPGIIEARQPI
ncbi:MAG: hypothetical protein MUO26_00230 [Methanotrichaceae archaeon]|nr:hypothetical protein [Methanotrichaceae archaeon]